MPPDSSRPLSGEPPTAPAPARWFTRGSQAARSSTPEPATAEKEPDTQPEPTVAGRPVHPDESPASPVPAPAEQMETSGPPEQSVSAKETPEKRSPAKETAERRTPAKETGEKRSPAKETAERRTPAKETAEKRTPAKRTAPGKTTARASSARRSRRPPPGGSQPSAR